MKIVARSFVVLFTAFGLAGLGHGQAPNGKTTPAAAAPAAPQGDAASPNNTGWVARCTSASREAPLECAMEQTAVLTKTGQLIVLVNIRVPGDTRTPVALIQLPLGLNLPVGAKLQVDDGKAVDVPIQTCEARGCYINAPIAPDVLTQLKSGKQLKVSFQNLGKETISIPMPLADFATVYDKIK
ncbi:invasion associated locus B family protein [Bradyrhizobium embrapense]|uniref:invasion associated locus B family protein n=1 Tax=Bradyrhizobium embrapense TaxID=630921 RepID=UPI000A008251|nr:invasion associated locus B family protein [Bradyrhizobium embrapense]